MDGRIRQADVVGISPRGSGCQRAEGVGTTLGLEVELLPDEGTVQHEVQHGIHERAEDRREEELLDRRRREYHVPSHEGGSEGVPQRRGGTAGGLGHEPSPGACRGDGRSGDEARSVHEGRDRHDEYGYEEGRVHGSGGLPQADAEYVRGYPERRGRLRQQGRGGEGHSQRVEGEEVHSPSYRGEEPGLDGRGEETIDVVHGEGGGYREQQRCEDVR
mmetsp:Transcript_18656/g.44898  ORF Transcript_18656/g.44898 Transcript_18656/m.44898 type:complete len:217 (+) Transcript_18656:653-1303(+)